MTLSRSAHVDTFCRDHLPAAEQLPDFVGLTELGYPERLNCAVELLDAVVRRFGADRPCLLSPDAPAWSYGQLQRTVNQLARVLVEDLGVRTGNRVLLRSPNNPWLVACWLAVLKAGAVAVPTMPLLRAGELATIAEIARVDLALCDHRFLDDLRAARIAQLPIVACGGPDPDDLTARAAAKPATFQAADTAADDVALLAFTSGTTGRPKATMHFHRDLLAIADTFAAQLVRPSPEDVFTGSPPLAFTFGLGGLVVFPLRFGARTLLVERATPDQLAELIQAHRVTVCFTAPTAYRAMLTAGKAAQLRSLRRAVSAGEHLPAATWHAFHQATGVKLIDGIGSTELLHIFLSAADEDIRPGATGRVVPGYQAEIVDDAGRPVPDGTIGRLAVRGPTGCRYLGDERQAAYVQRGWNITGDTFLRDAEGYFYYQARSDDMIVSSGYNISGPEVEEALLAHPDVLECGVVGVFDPDRGQLVTAFVVLATGVTGDAGEVARLQQHVKQQIAPYKYPRAIEFVTELPRTATGKLQRFVLRQRRTPAGPGAAACE
ncbi:MAG: AMP-binding protein [Jatrophihabitans sp.]